MAQRYIITLTSIPPRFDQITDTLESLLAQTIPAERVILYLNRSYRRFPDWDGTPPAVPKGVDIEWVDEDFGPATKILPAVRAYHGQDIDILFCDDDQVYRPHLAERLLAARRRHPDKAIAVSGTRDFPPLEGARRDHAFRPRRRYLWKVTNVGFHLRFWLRKLFCRLTGGPFEDPSRRLVLRPGYADAFEGWMGVLVRPGFFPEQAFDIPDFAWPVDDIWLSGHAMRSGHPVWVIGGFLEPYLAPVMKPAHSDNAVALNRIAFEGKRRRQLNNEAARYFQETYGIWR